MPGALTAQLSPSSGSWAFIRPAGMSTTATTDAGMIASSGGTR
ncbi:hypothetical protein [Kribbella sp. NPDC055071]